jgi:hypothetical protein
MKHTILTLTILFFSQLAFSQTETPKNIVTNQNIIDKNSIYQLYPTSNIWTFLKLDTRNGRIWQVHFSINNEESQGELVLNDLELATKENQTIGRFTLYPTTNIYNFLLLDKIDGTVIQIQWSFDSKNRGIISLIKPKKE